MFEWAEERWLSRRYDEQRGYGFPRWWRVREARRMVLAEARRTAPR